MSKSELDVAYDYLKEKGKSIPFKEIWDYVVRETGMDEEEAGRRMSKFFTNFMLDGRFVTMGENVWDLRERQTFDKVHIDMRDVYNDVETYDNDLEESEEEIYESDLDREEREAAREELEEAEEDEDSGIDFTEEDEDSVYNI